MVQTAAVLVLEPIFEADLQSEQHAYRAGHSVHDAVRAVHGLARRGHGEGVEADLSGYFDSIAHAQLMRSVARRVSERHVLARVKQWRVAPVEESDGRGGWRRITQAKERKRGIAQGAPVSPTLSNRHMRRFVLGWKGLGHERRLGAHIVNDADDFVICCRRGDAQASMHSMIERLGRR